MEQLAKPRLARQPPVPGIGGDGCVGGLELVAALRVALCRGGLGIECDLGIAHRPHGAHVGNGEDLVDPGETLDEVGVLRREDLPLGPFQPLVARRQIQRDPACPSIEKERGSRRLDPAEIVEGVGLPRELEPVGERSPLDDGHGLRTDAVEDPAPSGPELLGREVSLVVLSGRCGRGPEHQYEGGPQTAE